MTKRKPNSELEAAIARLEGLINFTIGTTNEDFVALSLVSVAARAARPNALAALTGDTSTAKQENPIPEEEI